MVRAGKDSSDEEVAAGLSCMACGVGWEVLRGGAATSMWRNHGEGGGTPVSAEGGRRRVGRGVLVIFQNLKDLTEK